ncbi:MAG: DUF308 domain-containing protein [Synergistaceae bacterium]|nr:DUF308 domain-containing protein [Synergistaceae bacterium]
MRLNSYITGIILIILGALTFNYPLEAIMTAGFFIGCGLVASGLNYFSGWYFLRFNRFIFLGLLDLIAGIIMILQPGLSAFLMPFVIGLWLLATGLARICAAFWLGGAKIRGWWMMLLNGVLLVLAALFVCASPLISSISLMLVLACVLIAAGVLVILEGHAVKTRF